MLERGFGTARVCCWIWGYSITARASQHCLGLICNRWEGKERTLSSATAINNPHTGKLSRPYKPRAVVLKQGFKREERRSILLSFPNTASLFSSNALHMSRKPAWQSVTIGNLSACLTLLSGARLRVHCRPARMMHLDSV